MQPKKTTGVVFANQLNALMQEKKVTQVRLAQEFQVSQAAVSKWLKGTVPSGETLVRLAHFFGATPEELVGLDSLRRPEAKSRGDQSSLKSVAGLGKACSLVTLDEEVDALFEKLKSRVMSGFSGCPPKESQAHLKALGALFGTDNLKCTKRKT
jgi:transcriptional regulator with XRE-family HTH domain